MSFEQDCAILDRISEAGADVYCSEEYREMLRDADIPDDIIGKSLIRMRLGREILSDMLGNQGTGNQEEKDAYFHTVMSDFVDSCCAPYQGEKRRGILITAIKTSKKILHEPITETYLFRLARMGSLELSDELLSLVDQATETIMMKSLEEKLAMYSYRNASEDAEYVTASPDALAAAAFLEDPVLRNMPIAVGATACGACHIRDELLESNKTAHVNLAFCFMTLSAVTLVSLLLLVPIDIVLDFAAHNLLTPEDSRDNFKDAVVKGIRHACGFLAVCLKTCVPVAGIVIILDTISFLAQCRQSEDVGQSSIQRTDEDEGEGEDEDDEEEAESDEYP